MFSLDPQYLFFFSKIFSWASGGEEMDNLCFFRGRFERAGGGLGSGLPTLPPALSSLHPCPRGRGGTGAKRFSVCISRKEEAV